MMNPQEFAKLFTEYFGERALLPMCLIYSEKPLGTINDVSGCMFKQFHHVFNGETVTFSDEKFTCGGGKLYCGLGPTPERVYGFVSQIEKYKSTPDVAKASISMIDAKLSVKPYLNFIRVDKLENFENVEGLLFFATPDILSGLFTWANYDIDDINAVQCPWGSGCSTTITSIVNENRANGKHCFIGMLDVSARPFFKPDILSFAIPMSRFAEMQNTLSQCCVSGAPTWLKVKKRINR